MSRRMLSVMLVAAVLLLAAGVSFVLLRQGRDPGTTAPPGAARGSTVGVIDTAGDCPICGMHVVPGNPRGAKATLRDGSVRIFCSTRCLLSWWVKMLEPKSQGNVPGQDSVVEMLVSDHYRHEPIPARQALYVVGSDVVGPMGPGFVPVAGPQDAALLVKDHGGRAVAFEQIDAALIDRVLMHGQP
jgi:copper chaperone NosL